MYETFERNPLIMMYVKCLEISYLSEAKFKTLNIWIQTDLIPISAGSKIVD